MREDRRELSQMLTGEGMSTRAAASVLGVDQKTVVNDTRGEEFSSPAKTEPLTEPSTVTVDVSTGEVLEEPAPVAVVRDMSGAQYYAPESRDVRAGVPNGTPEPTETGTSAEPNKSVTGGSRRESGAGCRETRGRYRSNTNK